MKLVEYQSQFGNYQKPEEIDFVETSQDVWGFNLNTIMKDVANSDRTKTPNSCDYL